MPTLAAHCGLIGFSSQKLMWRTKPFYEGGRRYPYTIGLWQGIDGSRIMMAHGFNYAQRWNDEDLSKSEMLMKEIKESPLNMAYRYYGTGDIGGSPNIPSVRAVEKGIMGNGPIQVVSATSDQLYRDYLPYENHPELPVFDGELPMDVHGNACYTSQAAMKLYNRQNEHLGDAAERAAVISQWLGKTKYPSARLTENWQRVIWHQFHDDLTGTSIPRAYEFSWNDELLALKTFSDIMTHSMSGIASEMDTQVPGQPVVVYQNESFPASSVAEVELDDAKNYQVSGPDGKRVLSQVVSKNGKYSLLFEAKAPSTGLSVYSIKASGKAKISTSSSRQIESSRCALTVDEYGDIVSLFDKQANKQLVAAGKSLRLVVFDDCRSERWPAWEIQKATLDKSPLPVHEGVQISTENGPLRQTMVIRKKYGDSDIVQRIHLYEGQLAERIDIENEVDWRSLNALLKAEFPLNVSNSEATYDIGLGTVRRGNNRDNLFEVYAHQWTDLTDHTGNYGVTLLTDSRYGWDKPNDQTMRLSLLYSPKTGQGYAYQAKQDFGHHVFTYSIVGHQGPLNSVTAVRLADGLNSPLRTFLPTKHKGGLGREFSFINSDNPNVMIRALKQAEISDELVVRIYEMGGKSEQKANITFAANILKAVEADGTERTMKVASFDGCSLPLEIKPYSVKTFKVNLASHDNHLSGSKVGTDQPTVLPLTYDRYCFSYNAFRGAADFEGGYSYAAELLPDDGIVVNDIPFRFGEKDAANGLTCRGNVLQLPSAEHSRRLHLLLASDNGDRKVEFRTGKKVQTFNVPYYTEFIGQWGHDGQTTGYLKDAEVAWVGSHRHSTARDEPYEFTYMFRIILDIPKGVNAVQLPDDAHVVIFAATLADDEGDLTAAAPLFKTSLLSVDEQLKTEQEKNSALNLMKEAKVIAVSGEVNQNERAVFLVDGNEQTKWCDSQSAPNFVEFDLGKSVTVKRWRMVNAACEQSSYITRTCLLQGRNDVKEEWKTLDMIDGNRKNIVERSFTPSSVRYVRLYVVSPTQGFDSAARIYELELY